MDAYVLTSTGGGISYQWLSWDATTKKWDSDFSMSLIMLLAESTKDAGFALDLAPSFSLGAFNNLVMIGAGYDLGSVPDKRSRFFGLLSIGINFNN